MHELLITIMLVIPAPHKMVATSVPCTYRPRSDKELIFMSPQASSEDNYCYAIFDTSNPTFIRHPNYWYSIELPKPHDPR